MSAVAPGVGLGSLAHRGWHPSSTAVGDPQLRQNYITPHCLQCPPVNRGALFVAATASRPAGEGNRRYAKLPSLERSPVVGAPRSLRALHAAACRPHGVLALWLMTGAARIVLVSGFAVHVVFAPAHPWACLLRSIARAVCPSTPQGGSLRTAPRHAAWRRHIMRCLKGWSAQLRSAQ